MLTVYPAESWAPRVRAHECHDKLSVCLSVRPSVCDVGGLWSHAFDLNNFTDD